MEAGPVTPPRVKLSPDGLLYVRTDMPNRPWWLYAPNGGCVMARAYGDTVTDDTAESWPEYRPPIEPEETTP